MTRFVWAMPADTIERFNNGELIADLATEYEVSAETVRRKLRAANVDTSKKPFRPGRHAKNAGIPRKTLPADLTTRYAHGASIRALSKEYKVDYNTVRRHLEYAGMAIRSQGRPRKHYYDTKEES